MLETVMMIPAMVADTAQVSPESVQAVHEALPAFEGLAKGLGMMGGVLGAGLVVIGAG